MIVDDHALFRAGVRAELDGLVDVVGDAGSVGEAIACVLELEPDVVLLDVQMPDGGGAEVIRGVTPQRPAIRFLALSVSDAPDDVISIIRAGARGYVTKTISGPELADAVRRVAGGDAVFSPRLAGFVLDAFAGGGGAPPPPRRPTRSSTSSPRASARSCGTSRAATSTRRSRCGSASRRRPWRPTSPPCCASCSSPTATSSAAGRCRGAGSSRPRSSTGRDRRAPGLGY